MDFARRWLGFTLTNIEEIAGVAFFLVMVVSVSIGVLFRYGFGRPLIWTEEVSGLCFLWAVFLGAAAAAKRREHIAVDTLVELIPPAGKRIVALATAAVVAAMLGAIAVLGVQFAWSQRHTTTEALELPVLLYALAVPLSSALAFRYAVRDLVRLLQGVPLPATQAETSVVETAAPVIAAVPKGVQQ